MAAPKKKTPAKIPAKKPSPAKKAPAMAKVQLKNLKPKTPPGLNDRALLTPASVVCNTSSGKSVS